MSFDPDQARAGQYRCFECCSRAQELFFHQVSWNTLGCSHVGSLGIGVERQFACLGLLALTAFLNGLSQSIGVDDMLIVGNLNDSSRARRHIAPGVDSIFMCTLAEGAMVRLGLDG